MAGAIRVIYYMFQDPKHGWCDKGGAYVSPDHRNLLRHADEYGVKPYQIYHKGDGVSFREVLNNNFF